MKKFLMIAALALVAPLANAEDQAAADQAAADAEQKAADMAAVEITEGAAVEGASGEATELTEETAGTTDAAQ